MHLDDFFGNMLNFDFLNIFIKIWPIFRFLKRFYVGNFMPRKFLEEFFEVGQNFEKIGTSNFLFLIISKPSRRTSS